MSSSILGFLVLVCAGLVQAQFRDVVLEQGVVRGYHIDDDEVFSFYGIPYATAPTGEDRFKGPLPPRSWDGIFNATEKFIGCPQGRPFFMPITVTIDCLRVHVLVPRVNATNLPVFFSIHGGGYQVGTPVDLDPTELVKRGMIVVNFNYRVSLHGFLCLNTEYAPGNAGMKDQVEALKWVHRNIAQFGGDPNRITIGGSSAGAFASELQMLSPMSQGLFARVTSDSGSALSAHGITHSPLAVAEIYARKFNVTTGQNVTALENFFRSLSDADLSIGYDSDFVHVGFAPCIETHNVPGVEKFLVEDPRITVINGNYNPVPYMSGYSIMEGLDFAASYNAYRPFMENNLRDFIPSYIQFESDEKAEELLQGLRDVYFPTGEITLHGFVDYMSDYLFSFGQYSAARLHARNSVPVYIYLFSYNGTVNYPNIAINGPIWGPGHAVIQIYIQNLPFTPQVYQRMTEEEILVRDRLRDLYVNFVKTGVPTTNLIDLNWSPTTSRNVEYVDMNRDFVQKEFPLRERMEAWDKLHNYPYMTDDVETDTAATSTFSVLLLGFSFIALLL